MQASPIEGPLILRPALGEHLLPIAAVLMFSIGGILMVKDGDWTGWVCLALAVLIIGVGLFNLMPGGACLRLTATGFEVRSLFRKVSQRWGDVAGFYVVNVSVRWKRERVGWHWGSPARDWLPSNYGLEPAELAALMNTWQRRAMGKLAT